MTQEVTQNPHERAFLSSIENLEVVQQDLLHQRILLPNANTEYGQQFKFSQIQSAKMYRDTVPLVDYEDLRPLIDRMSTGETNVLTAERLIAFFKTSGSLSSPKLIPVTSSLVREKMAAFATFWGQVYEAYPIVRDGAMVSNFSDASGTENSEAGIEITSESGFWSRRGRSLHSIKRWPLPAEVRHIGEPEARMFATARLLLQADLHCIMCLNPSTLLQFCRTVESAADQLAIGLHDGTWGTGDADILAVLAREDLHALGAHLRKAPERAERVKHAVRNGQAPKLIDLWPELKLVICWSSAVVQPYFVHLRPYVEGVAIRDYITQSSECMMAIPLGDGTSGGALAYQSHFFEFIPESEADKSSPRTLFSWQLEDGAHYELVVTTGGGLYRYRMGDCFRVNGFTGAEPLVEFLDRLGKTSSMTGEKLTEYQVIEAAARASRQCGVEPGEYLCYPSTLPTPHYGLLFDPSESILPNSDIARWAAAFDQHLGEVNSEYGDKCESGRLGVITAYRVEPGTLRAARHARRATGVSDEQVKSEVLTRLPDLHIELSATECIS
ncbi:MAG: GH3 auxin-responsive promoter family protein [Granulosicoccus sp.]